MFCAGAEFARSHTVNLGISQKYAIGFRCRVSNLGKSFNLSAYLRFRSMELFVWVIS